MKSPAKKGTMEEQNKHELGSRKVSTIQLARKRSVKKITKAGEKERKEKKKKKKKQQKKCCSHGR